MQETNGSTTINGGEAVPQKTTAAGKSTSKPLKKLSASKLKPVTKITTDVDALLDKKDEAENETEVETEDFYGNDPFTFDDIKKYWLEFANQKKAEGKDSEHMVLRQDITLKDNSTIVIKMTNTVNLDILDRFRSDLITYLKRNLKNGNITLETEMVQEETKRMIYTNKDKFDYLAEKKPILNQLRERLGLDPDF